MLSIYICEDDIKQREHMVQSIAKCIKNEGLSFFVSCATDNPYKILDLARKDEHECVFFLDIDLGQDMNGVELSSRLRLIKPRCFIIFVTTHSEMSYFTFNYKVEAMDYIIKDNVNEVDNRIRACLINCNCLSGNNPEEGANTYSIKIGGKIKIVPMDEIVYFEVSNVNRKILLYGERLKIEFLGNLKGVEKEVDNRFYRCHKSFLINKDKIKGIENNHVVMSNGVKCPISIRLKSGLRSAKNR